MFQTIRFTKSLFKLGENIFNNNKNIHTCFTQIPRRFASISNTESSNTQIKIEGINESIDISELTQNEPEVEKKLRVIALEADILRQESGRVPNLCSLKQKHWEELLSKTSRSQRNKYFDFLFRLEKKNENKIAKKEKAKEERENRPEYPDDGHIRYGLNHNTFFLRIYDSTINQLYNSKLINAIQFGQKIVIDCSYDKNMTTRECQNCAKQLMLLFSDNRFHDDPFDLHLCNVNLNGKTIQSLHNFIPIMYEPWFPLNIHEGNYLDIFPKDKLVYLTPHCREELTHYDHDAVYIIGAIVDKINNEPVSLARAKRDGIKTKKFPLDRYLQWGAGSGKSLTLNQCASILLDVKKDGDWSKALGHVPRRKIIGAEENIPIYKENREWNMKADVRNINKRRTNLKNNNFVNKLLQN